jgi:hypothetical protein
VRSTIKLTTLSLLSALLLLGCGGGQGVSTSTSSNSTVEKETANAGTPTPMATTQPTTSNSEKPIEFTYLGVTPDKEHIRYRIKVNTAKQITQVDLAAKYMDDGGKVLDDTTLLWQNIIRSKHQPIEKGKTYDVEDYLPGGATKADLVLKRVVFVDGTFWKAN